MDAPQTPDVTPTAPVTILPKIACPHCGDRVSTVIDSRLCVSLAFANAAVVGASIARTKPSGNKSLKASTSSVRLLSWRKSAA